MAGRFFRWRIMVPLTLLVLGLLPPGLRLEVLRHISALAFNPIIDPFHGLFQALR